MYRKAPILLQAGWGLFVGICGEDMLAFLGKCARIKEKAKAAPKEMLLWNQVYTG